MYVLGNIMQTHSNEEIDRDSTTTARMWTLRKSLTEVPAAASGTEANGASIWEGKVVGLLFNEDGNYEGFMLTETLHVLFVHYFMQTSFQGDKFMPSLYPALIAQKTGFKRHFQ